MKVLYFGDVYAKPGREAVKIAIQRLVPLHQVDFVILNAENLTHGNGASPEMLEEMFRLGVDAVTLGNHAWDQRAIIPYLSTTTRVVRPINFPDHPAYKCPGRGSTVLECVRRKRPDGKPIRLGLIQAMGRVFMDSLDCPFRTTEKEVQRLSDVGVDCLFVDFHAEASSEKQAFANFLDGRVSAVVGSHSHVQTADERILPNGTAAITDVGMTGCYDSVIGVKKELSIQKFITKRPVKYEAAEGLGGYGCVVIEIDEDTGKAKSILRLREAVVS